jgi:hypothetical protein
MARSKALTLGSTAAPHAAVLVGGRYVDVLQKQLDHLHALPAHGNRVVGLDHLVIAHVLAFFNPSLRGLRDIEDVFEAPAVRKRMGTPTLCKSTVADAQRLFDPQLLLPLIESLQERAGPSLKDPRLSDITSELLACDGTFFAVAPRIAWAIFNGTHKGNVRAHFQFRVFSGVPDLATLTDGQAGEVQQLREALRASCFYVLDRGFNSYPLWADIDNIKSDVVVRARSDLAMRTLQERGIEAADMAAGVLADQQVEVGWRADQTPTMPPRRCVSVRFVDRHGHEQLMLLITNRMDLPAWKIALIYQHRWQVEIFFRWLKCVAHFNHFFSESREGMTLQIYVAIISMLLITIQTGARPSQYDYSLMGFVLSGMITMAEFDVVATKRRAERARAKESDRLRRAKKLAK